MRQMEIKFVFLVWQLW